MGSWVFDLGLNLLKILLGFSYKSSLVSIRSASWGPRDDGMHMEYPGKLVNMALEEGVKYVSYFMIIKYFNNQNVEWIKLNLKGS